MASYPRKLLLSDRAFFHITWQAHNRSWLLKENWAKKLYYDLLLKFSPEYGVQIFSYSFMDSHPHLTGFATTQSGVSDLMKRINSIFAKAINRHYRRRGQVVMDRFKSPQIQTSRHLLSVMTYIDLNPVRAKIVRHPRDYRWTSFDYYAFGDKDPLITPAPCYLDLGSTPEKRQRAYLKLVEEIIEKDSAKQNYSYTCFIGNPAWVAGRHRELIRTARREAHRMKTLPDRAPPPQSAA